MRHEKIRSLDHENQLYERAKVLSMRLKIPFVETKFKVTRIDTESGRHVEIDRHSRSYTRNFYNTIANIGGCYGPMLTTGGYEDGSIVPKGTNGIIFHTYLLMSSKNINDAAHAFNAPAGSDTIGIIIGTGVTAESFDDYFIETPIAHGGGQMDYAILDDVLAWDAGDREWSCTCTRVFTNNSGGTITVTEAVSIYQSTSNTLYDVCWSRDVFSGVAVLDGQSIEVEYKYIIAFP